MKGVSGFGSGSGAAARKFDHGLVRFSCFPLFWNFALLKTLHVVFDCQEHPPDLEGRTTTCSGRLFYSSLRKDCAALLIQWSEPIPVSSIIDDRRNGENCQGYRANGPVFVDAPESIGGPQHRGADNENVG